MLDDYIANRLHGRRILVVEDDFLLAEDLSETLRSFGVEVVGPVPSVDDALALLSTEGLPDAAVLDVRVADGTVYPLAEALDLLRVPFIFATAYPNWVLPESYEMRPHVEKPLEMQVLLRKLAGLSQAA